MNNSRPVPLFLWVALAAAVAVVCLVRHFTPYPKYAGVFDHFGQDALRSNQRERARGLFERAIVMDPSRAESYAGIGLSFSKENRFSEALPYFQKAVELERTNDSLLNSLGETYFQLGFIDRAVSYFEMAVRTPSNFGNLGLYRYNLGLAYVHRGDALSAFEQVRVIRGYGNFDLAGKLQEQIQRYLDKT